MPHSPTIEPRAHPLDGYFCAWASCGMFQAFGPQPPAGWLPSFSQDSRL